MLSTLLAFLAGLAVAALVAACRHRDPLTEDDLRAVRRGPDRGSNRRRTTPLAPTGPFHCSLSPGGPAGPHCCRSGDDPSLPGSSSRGGAAEAGPAPVGPVDPEDYGIPPVVLGPEGLGIYLKGRRQ